MHRPRGRGPWRRSVEVVVAVAVVVVGPVVLVELVDVDEPMLVLVDVVLEVAVVVVDDWSSENRHPRSGGRNVTELLIGGDGWVVGVPVPVPEVVVVVGETGAVVDVVGPVVVVVVVELVVVELVVAEAPRSIRSTANPTISNVASDAFRTSRRGQRRGVSSGSSGLGISWRM